MKSGEVYGHRNDTMRSVIILWNYYFLDLLHFTYHQFRVVKTMKYIFRLSGCRLLHTAVCHGGHLSPLKLKWRLNTQEGPG